MAKFLRPGKVVVVLNGRFAGKKAVITSLNKKFGCALVVGVERCPLKVTKSMGAKRIARRSHIKPFVKLINYTHMMPTRYNFDVDFKDAVNTETLKDAATKKAAKKEIKKVLEEKYKTGQNKWFFQKLRF